VTNPNLDDDVRRAWKAASRDGPPAALDDAIRAAARREVGARPRRRSTPNWVPMALAATLGVVAVAIVQLTPPERVTAPQSVSDAAETQLAEGRVQQTPMPAASEARTPAASQASRPAASQAPTPAASQAPTPAASQAPTPAASQAPTPAASQAPMPEASQAPTPAASQAPIPEASQAGTPAASHAPMPAASRGPEAAPSQARPNAATQADRRQVQARESADPRAFAPGPLPHPFADASGRGEVGPASITIPPPPQAARPAPAPTPTPPSTADVRKQTSGLAGAAESANVDRPAAVAQAPAVHSKAFAEASRPERAVSEWVALIRRLRTEGRMDEAAKELADFRAAHGANADALLPPDLKQAPAR